jgi:hypothetical protein
MSLKEIQMDITLPMSSFFYIPTFGFVKKSLIVKPIIILLMFATLFFVKIPMIDTTIIDEVNVKQEQVVRYIISKHTGLTISAIKNISDSIVYESEKHNIPVNLLLGIIDVESRYDMFAVSASGAIGLMQILPQWHRDKIKNMADRNIYNPKTNISLGATILDDCMKHTKSLKVSLGCYNGNVNDRSHRYATKVLNSIPTFD